MDVAGRSLGSGSLSSLEGIEGLGNCLKSLGLEFCMSLRSLSGIEGLTAIENLELYRCGVTSLQPVKALVTPGLKRVLITSCSEIAVEEKQLGLPHIAATAVVAIEDVSP